MRKIVFQTLKSVVVKPQMSTTRKLQTIQTVNYCQKIDEQKIAEQIDLMEENKTKMNELMKFIYQNYYYMTFKQKTDMIQRVQFYCGIPQNLQDVYINDLKIYFKTLSVSELLNVISIFLKLKPINKQISILLEKRIIAKIETYEEEEVKVLFEQLRKGQFVKMSTIKNIFELVVQNQHKFQVDSLISITQNYLQIDQQHQLDNDFINSVCWKQIDELQTYPFENQCLQINIVLDIYNMILVNLKSKPKFQEDIEYLSYLEKLKQIQDRIVQIFMKQKLIENMNSVMLLLCSFNEIKRQVGVNLQKVVERSVEQNLSKMVPDMLLEICSIYCSVNKEWCDITIYEYIQYNQKELNISEILMFMQMLNHFNVNYKQVIVVQFISRLQNILHLLDLQQINMLIFQLVRIQMNTDDKQFKTSVKHFLEKLIQVYQRILKESKTINAKHINYINKILIGLIETDSNVLDTKQIEQFVVQNLEIIDYRLVVDNAQDFYRYEKAMQFFSNRFEDHQQLFAQQIKQLDSLLETKKLID